MPPPVPAVGINTARADYDAGSDSFAATVPWTASAPGATEIQVERRWAERTARGTFTGSFASGSDAAPIDVDVSYRARARDSTGWGPWSGSIS